MPSRRIGEDGAVDRNHGVRLSAITGRSLAADLGAGRMTRLADGSGASTDNAEPITSSAELGIFASFRVAVPPRVAEPDLLDGIQTMRRLVGRPPPPRDMLGTY